MLFPQVKEVSHWPHQKKRKLPSNEDMEPISLSPTSVSCSLCREGSDRFSLVFIYLGKSIVYGSWRLYTFNISLSSTSFPKEEKENDIAGGPLLTLELLCDLTTFLSSFFFSKRRRVEMQVK
jgi:hypothetical protein